jgi:nitrogen regulatory protein P-II 1
LPHRNSTTERGWQRDPDLDGPVVLETEMNMVALDDDAEPMAETIAKHAYTGVIGDGEIWIAPVGSVLRVRTGDRDRTAV